MADKIPEERRSWNMSRIRSKGMKPEMVVRRLIHSMGYRYRLHRKDLPGKPDLVFGPSRKVIFVHGCFWHQHEDPSCKIARIPKTKLDYWMPKLRRNVERDHEHQAQLKEQGWHVLVLWECELKGANVTVIRDRVRMFLDGNRVP